MPLTAFPGQASRQRVQVPQEEAFTGIPAGRGALVRTDVNRRAEPKLFVTNNAHLPIQPSPALVATVIVCQGRSVFYAPDNVGTDGHGDGNAIGKIHAILCRKIFQIRKPYQACSPLQQIRTKSRAQMIHTQTSSQASCGSGCSFLKVNGQITRRIMVTTRLR